MLKNSITSFFKISYFKTCSAFLFNPKNNSIRLFNSTLQLKKMENILNYEIHERGVKNTDRYRIFYSNSDINTAISPFHDIPYKVNAEKNIFHMVVEIPRWTNEKMEIATKESMNPIKQDVKNGNLRYVRNVFPFHGYIWNYGAIPQTWENPEKEDPETGYKGDNDPVDACEIGSRIHRRGEIIQVKILGCFALIDENETDWKLIVVDVKDPMSEKLNDLNDIERIYPGLLAATREWFRIYKVPDGKPKNSFAFDGEPKNRNFALKILENCHKEWEELITDKVQNNSKLSLHNTSLKDNPHKIDNPKSLLANVTPFSYGNQLSISDLYEIEKWHYVDK